MPLLGSGSPYIRDEFNITCVSGQPGDNIRHINIIAMRERRRLTSSGIRYYGLGRMHGLEVRYRALGR